MSSISSGNADYPDGPGEKPKMEKQKNENPIILIVDDVPENVQVLGTILRENGFRIAIAREGKQALDIVEKRRPDLVLLDIMMPEMDGFEVCKRLKEHKNTADIPVIFLTACIETDNVVKGFECGAADYVTKPFKRAELLARVQTQLKLKKAREEIIFLEQRNAVLAMSVTAGHELNQPLTVLEGNFELFKQSVSPCVLTEKQQKYLSKMDAALEHVQDLLRKFTESQSIRFDNYLGNQKMVVFEGS